MTSPDFQTRFLHQDDTSISSTVHLKPELKYVSSVSPKSILFPPKFSILELLSTIHIVALTRNPEESSYLLKVSKSFLS